MTFKNNYTILVAPLLLGACASHNYVDRKIGELRSQNERIEEAQNERIEQLDKTTREALGRANSAYKLTDGKMLFTSTLLSEVLRFKDGEITLSQEQRKSLLSLADKLKTANKNVHLEIQGHTDSAGSSADNLRIAQMRADAVRHFLSKNGIPLNRISTISYGESEPIASNATQKGRDENRRVVILVLK